jgi:hypothetical protein
VPYKEENEAIEGMETVEDPHGNFIYVSASRRY